MAEQEQAEDTPPPSSSPPKDSEDSGSCQNNNLECMYVFSPKDPVVTPCGHLFCWPCIYRWMETRGPSRSTCPVCKSVITKDRIIPIYGKDSNNEDPREKTTAPPRPAGHREEPSSRGGFGAGADWSPFGNFHNGFGNFQVSFGIGAFPFMVFGSLFNICRDPRPPPPAPDTPGHVDERHANRVFIILAVFFILWYLFT